MRACSKTVTVMLRTWSGMYKILNTCIGDRNAIFSGLMYLFLYDMQAIRSIIDNLRIPSLETRVRVILNCVECIMTKLRLQEVILDMFFELLNIKPPEWYQTFIDGRRLTSAC